MKELIQKPYITRAIQNTVNKRQLLMFPMGTPRWIDLDSKWILRWYIEDQISTNFHVISSYFFDVISLIEKSTSFPRLFFYVILMIEKSTLFPHFCRCNFDGRKIHLASTYFFWRNFDGWIIHFVCMYFFRQNFDEFGVIVGKLYANENVWGGFPLLVTLKSRLLQDCSH